MYSTLFPMPHPAPEKNLNKKHLYAGRKIYSRHNNHCFTVTPDVIDHFKLLCSTIVLPYPPSPCIAATAPVSGPTELPPAASRQKSCMPSHRSSMFRPDESHASELLHSKSSFSAKYGHGVCSRTVSHLQKSRPSSSVRFSHSPHSSTGHIPYVHLLHRSRLLILLHISDTPQLQKLHITDAFAPHHAELFRCFLDASSLSAPVTTQDFPSKVTCHRNSFSFFRSPMPLEISFILYLLFQNLFDFRSSETGGSFPYPSTYPRSPPYVEYGGTKLRASSAISSMVMPWSGFFVNLSRSLATESSSIRLYSPSA